MHENENKTTNPRALAPEVLANVRKAIDTHGVEAVASAAGVSQFTIQRACAGGGTQPATLAAIQRGLVALATPKSGAST